jgi:hypothetical protein
MYAELQQAGQLQASVYEAQERTLDAMYQLQVEQNMPYDQAWELIRQEWAFLPEEERGRRRVMAHESVPLSPEGNDYLFEVLLWLMGGETLYDKDGEEVATVCGARNVPPSVPGIRHVLQRANEAGIEPSALYQRAVEVHDRLDTDRRREYPVWTWPAPPYEAVEPATWPPLEPEVLRAVHEALVSRALWARHDEPDRVQRLRSVLARAQARGLDPEALYQDAARRLTVGRADAGRPPAPRYELVRPAARDGRA